jgi:sulfur-oxidizing protein SoxY
VDGALNGLFGSSDLTGSDNIKIKAPDIAENGAVVPVSVTTDISGASSISIIAEKNAQPLAASFDLGPGTEGYVSTRIKMGKTASVIAVVKADGKLHSTGKEVKVTIGGCGG